MFYLHKFSGVKSGKRFVNEAQCLIWSCLPAQRHSSSVDSLAQMFCHTGKCKKKKQQCNYTTFDVTERMKLKSVLPPAETTAIQPPTCKGKHSHCCWQRTEGMKMRLRVKRRRRIRSWKRRLRCS